MLRTDRPYRLVRDDGRGEEIVLTGLRLLQPGVVSLPWWRPDPSTSYTDREISQYGGVARKPGLTSRARCRRAAG